MRKLTSVLASAVSPPSNGYSSKCLTRNWPVILLLSFTFKPALNTDSNAPEILNDPSGNHDNANSSGSYYYVVAN